MTVAVYALLIFVVMTCVLATFDFISLALFTLFAALTALPYAWRTLWTSTR